MKAWLPEQGGNKSVVSDSSDSLFLKHGNSAWKAPRTSSLEAALAEKPLIPCPCPCLGWNSAVVKEF